MCVHVWVPEIRQQIAVVSRALLWGRSGPLCCPPSPAAPHLVLVTQPPFPPAAAPSAHIQSILCFAFNTPPSTFRFKCWWLPC